MEENNNSSRKLQTNVHANDNVDKSSPSNESFQNQMQME